MPAGGAEAAAAVRVGAAEGTAPFPGGINQQEEEEEDEERKMGELGAGAAADRSDIGDGH
jgi:hypothetical protein